MIGAAAGLDLLPLDRDAFKSAVAAAMTPDKAVLNLKAFDQGAQMVSN